MKKLMWGRNKPYAAVDFLSLAIVCWVIIVHVVSQCIMVTVPGGSCRLQPSIFGSYDKRKRLPVGFLLIFLDDAMYIARFLRVIKLLSSS